MRFTRLGRSGWGRGTRRKPVPGGSMAPCSCALSCAHGKTGVGRPAQPARGMPRAHGANGPAPPPRPTPDSFRARPATEKKKEDQKQKQPGWPLFVEPSPRSAAFRPVRETDRRLGSRASAARDPLLLFFILFRGLARTEIVSGRVGGGGGVSAAWVGRMRPTGWAGRPTPVLPCAQDSAHVQAAAKPPWTGSRRPRQPHPPGQPPGSRHSATKPRGAAPLAGNYGHQPRPNRAK